MDKICENSSQKCAPETEKFYLQGPTAQTMGSIQKLIYHFFSLLSTKQIICPSQLSGVNIFWGTSFFLSGGHPKQKVSFTKIKFSRKLLVLSTNLKNQLPLFFTLFEAVDNHFLIRPTQFAQIEKISPQNGLRHPVTPKIQVLEKKVCAINNSYSSKEQNM